MAKEAYNSYPDDPVLRLQLAASLGSAGRIEEAQSVLAEGQTIDPTFLDRPGVQSWFKGAGHDRFMDSLHKVGWPA